MARKKKDNFNRRSKRRTIQLKQMISNARHSRFRKRLENAIFPIAEQESQTVSEEELPELTIERGPPPPKDDPKLKTLQGRRVVDLRQVITQARELERHRCPVDSTAIMQFQREHRLGLQSTLHYKCSHCDQVLMICTDSVPIGQKKGDNDSNLSINDDIVWGAVSIGLGHDPLEELFSVLGVPCLSAPTFRKLEDSLGHKWQKLLSQYMHAAAMEEIALARAAQPKREEADGLAWTIGILDGGWSQRSHGHRYTAKSGCAVIIGYYTKKLIYLGVRNKFCFVCTKADNKGETPSPHNCFLNWNGPSTAMEANIIVEGFRFCLDEYKLRITKFVGDGDSSVLSAITNCVPYGPRVEKIECANHVVKNLTKNLYDIAKGKNSAFLSAPRIKHLSRAVRGTISRNKGNTDCLISDLRNVPDHVLGDHRKCRSGICSKAGDISNSQIIEKFPRDLLAGIRQAVGRVAAKAHSLVSDSTSNLAENYMSLVAKFTGGKQINRSQQGSYTRRCHAAGLSFNCRGSWHGEAWKKITTRSPNVTLKRFCSVKMKRQAACRRRLLLEKKNPKRMLKTSAIYKPEGDEHYGPNALQPDVSSDEMKILCEEYYANNVEVSDQDRNNIEEQTRTQSGADGITNSDQLWWVERRKRLTASNFGPVCKMKETTSCRATVRRLLYDRPVSTPATMYGLANESVAIAQYEGIKHASVNKCGLVIDVKHNFLAASPDGLVGDSGVLEVKCPFSANNMSPLDASRTLKQFPCTCDSRGELRLKRSHNYYYQIQGQLNITRRDWCDFVVWTPKGLSLERIVRDDNFWTKVMLPKLERFYNCCVLPELSKPRHTLGMGIREAKYVLEARKAIEEKGKKRKKGDDD